MANIKKKVIYAQMSTELPVLIANWVKRQRHKVKREAKSN